MSAAAAAADQEVSNFNANAANIQSNSVSKGTVKTYQRCIAAFKKYTLEQYENSTHDALSNVFTAAADQFVLPMSVQFVEWYLGYLASRRVIPKSGRKAKKSRAVVPVPAPVPVVAVAEKPLCVSVFTGLCSAVVWYHHSRTVVVEGSLNVAMREFIKGYRRTIADLKLNNLYPMMEGKNYLTCDGYEALLDFGLKLGEEQSRFSQSVHFVPYLVLLWNTIARVHSVGLLSLEHFGLANGCIFVKVPASKCDQDGENAFPKHMFSNVKEPKYCVVLALAMAVWTMALNVSTRLFPGNFPERKFCDILHVVIGTLPDPLKAIMTAIGAHSVKKGACTFLNGVLEGPNAHAVELRADHSIGDVRKCYIFRSVAQDQYCGRLLAMRDTESQYFFADLPKLDQCALEWETLLPGYSHVPANFKPLLPHLLAALVQHSDWLRGTLPAGHPLLLTPLFRMQHIHALKSQVVITYKTCGGGIPRSVALAESQRQMPGRVAQHITENFAVTGVAAMTPAMFSQILEEKFTRYNASVQQCVNASGVLSSGAMMHLWPDGFYHELPATFMLTSFDIQNAFLMYFQGDPGTRTLPYKRIKFEMLPTKSVSQKILLSRLHCVVKALISKSGLSALQLTALTSTAQLTAAFDVALRAMQAEQPLCSKSWSFSYFYKVTCTRAE
jgi:hypothetical protein